MCADVEQISGQIWIFNTIFGETFVQRFCLINYAQRGWRSGWVENVSSNVWNNQMNSYNIILISRESLSGKKLRQ